MATGTRVPCLAPAKRSKGFTLVEVLVAMFIMSIIAIMAWQGVDGIVRSRAISQTKLEQLLRVNTVLMQFEQDLNAVYDAKALAPLQFNGANLRITRRAPGGVQLVVWSLRAGTWQRWAGTPVTRTDALNAQWMSSLQFMGNEEGQLHMLQGIGEWQLYYFRDNAWTNAQSSAGSSAQSAAPAASAVVTTTALPQGVRLSLNFSESSGMAGQVTRDFLMPPQP